MDNKAKKEIFESLKKLIKKHGKGFNVTKEVNLSKALGNKEQLHIYGKKDVSIAGRKEQPTYVAGIIMQKHFVGFYLMPIYSHPKKYKVKHPELIKSKKGKSCFNITKLDDNILKELSEMLDLGIGIYKEEGWI